MPIKMIDLELTEKINAIWGLEEFDGVRVLVRYLGRPTGWVYIDLLSQPYISAERLRELIIEQIGWDLIPQKLREIVMPMPKKSMSQEPISVIVCTRNRTEYLQHCLNSLLALDYSNCEIIVADNAPQNDLTSRLVDKFPVRYVREDRPGLNWARNRGIEEAKYDIIAFTDDDARPDRLWLQAIAHAFSESEIMAVTGLVAPLELDTHAQIYFELVYGGMGKGFRSRRLRRTELKTSQLLWASSFGTGTNMAYRRKIFSKIGSFDVALDVGTSSKGGGDIEFFHRLVSSGYTLLYEPAAIVWHNHRVDYSSLKQQIFDNGCGFGTYLITCMRNHTVRRYSILGFFIREWLGWWIVRRLLRPKGHRRRLVATELLGMLRSPIAYKLAQRCSRKPQTEKLS